MAALEKVREVSGLSRDQVAWLLGVDLFTVAVYDEGAIPVPDEHAAKLGEVCAVSPEFVQCGDEIVREALLEEYPGLGQGR